ncbi:N-acetylglucosamine transferase [Terricaulis sp.]|uniref:O-linked N-acetylglucosamine transferase, SPINDLY family protein n=1 Tax=Terricaulis sp. TaxID=2768686 RepID=UPI00378477AD
MSQTLFVSALQKVTTGELTFNELISAAQALTQASQIGNARQLYQVWIAMNGDHPLVFVAHFNCSTLLAQLGENEAAEIALRSALAANPDFTPAHINLGSAMERRGAVREAVEQWRLGLDRMNAVTGDAIEYKITLLKQLSRVLTDNHQHEAAEAALTQCLDLKAEQRDVLEQYAAVRLAQCKWPIAGGATPKVSRRDFVTRFHPLSACAYADDPLMHLALANQYVQALTPPASIPTHFDRRDAIVAPSGRRLRIGYVSSDLRAHAVGYLMANLFETHDRNAVEVFVYYTGIPADDIIAQRVRAVAEHWLDMRAMSDDEAAARICDDAIDILIDVNGHTRDARLGIFARRPAPIQVNWLGYPGTMGSPYHHYIIGDEHTIPADMEHYYSEKVLRLPCYQPNDRNRLVAPQTPSRSSMGLPEDAFVFCCFNAAHKITRFSFDRWMEILRRTPGSVLWLLDYNGETNARLRAAADAAGVDGQRLVFAQKIANAHHLARYPLADLFLDTIPYGAHTTASDALWMGVPVITLEGRSFASRVCGSLVRAAGLPELVCAGPDTFVERAVALATERTALAALRQRLTAGRDTCVLFDITLLARKLEQLYRDMAAAHLQGARPTPNLANLDAYLDIGAVYDHDQTEIGLAPNYEDVYRAALEARHFARPMPADGRLWDGEADAGADGIERAA